MRKYKLIKSFPNCIINIGDIVKEDGLGQFFHEKTITIFQEEDILNFPEFWEEVVESNTIKEVQGEDQIKWAVETLSKHLKEDRGYWKSWKANIAMAFVDEIGTTKFASPCIITKFSNKAAERFLKQLTADETPSNCTKDAKAGATVWRPTMELRNLRIKFVKYQLQQKWVEQNSGAEEWRNIETVD